MAGRRAPDSLSRLNRIRSARNSAAEWQRSGRSRPYTLNLGNPNANVSSTTVGVVGGLRTPGGGLPGSGLIQLGLKWMF